MDQPCSGSGGKAAYLPTGYPFGDGADLVFLGTSHDCCARCSDDESGGMTSLYLQTMKLFASVFGSIAIAAVSMMPRAASGYEYGESCCEYNGKRLGDCHFYPSKNGLRIEWSDGLVESYKLISKRDFGGKTYLDKRGGVWQYLLYAQGNQSLTNEKNGNRIFKPLRGCMY